MLNSLYGRLNRLTLIRCNARAILSRPHFASCEQVSNFKVFDVLLNNNNNLWLGLKVINPLNLQFIQEAAQTCGHAAEMGEEAKHSRNDEACALRGWSCIPLVVEVFGGWGNETINVLLAISKMVATQLCRPLNEVMSGIYSRLSLPLMRQNARPILARCVSPNTCCDF